MECSHIPMLLCRCYGPKVKETEALFVIVLDHKKVKSLAIRVSGVKFQKCHKTKVFCF